MTLVNRRDFTNLDHLGVIDTHRANDPVSRLVKELGIDMSKIGDGDAVIEDRAEYGQVYDQLKTLDEKAPIKGLGRAERLYRAVLDDRSVPDAKSYEQMRTKGGWSAGSSEIRTKNAARLLDRLGVSSPKPPDIGEPTAYAKWAAHEADRLDGMRTDVTARQHELELLIGYRSADGTEKLGYYDRLIRDAKKYVAEQKALGAKGDVKAKAAAENGEKAIRWAEREQAEARAVFRDYVARAGTTGWIDDAGDALRGTKQLLGENQTVFDAHAGAAKAYLNAIELAQTKGEIPPELLDSAPWIARFQDTQVQLEATATLHQKLLARAEKDPIFAEWLESAKVVEALELQEQRLILQLNEISGVIEAQKTQEVAGKTGMVLGLRDESLALAEEATGALMKEDHPRLEQYERELKAKRAELKTEIERLKQEKARLEKIAKTPDDQIHTADELFKVRSARLELQGVVPDQLEKPISLARQIKILEHTDEVLRLAKQEVNSRNQYLTDVLGQLRSRYGLPPMMETNAKPFETIVDLDRNAPVKGFERKGDVLSLTVGDKTFRMSANSSYGTQRRFVDEYAKLQAEQQARTYLATRAVLLEIGVTYDDLDGLGLGKDSFHELPKMMSLFNEVTGRYNDVEHNKELIQWAQNPTAGPPGTAEPSGNSEGAAALAKHLFDKGFKTFSRKDLLDLVANSKGVPSKAHSFARVLLVSKELRDQLGVDRSGNLRVTTLAEFARQTELLDDYYFLKGQRHHKPEPPGPGEPVPAYFAEAGEIVKALDPKAHKWNGPENPVFEKLKDLNKDQRAYVLGLYEATYAGSYGEEHLKDTLNGMEPGEAHGYMSLLSGRTALEAGDEFERDYLKTGKSADDFVQHHNAGIYYVDKANARDGWGMPENMISAYDSRVREMIGLNEKRNVLLAKREQLTALHNKNVDNKTPDPVSDKELSKVFTELNTVEARMKKIAGEMEILGDALIDAHNGEVGDHNARVERNRTIFKKLAVAALATVAAYATAGALAPEAGALWAGVAATAVGTGAGMGTAFVIDIAEQAHDHGWSKVSAKHAGWAALDAAPDAFSAALPTGFLTAAMVGRAGMIYKGLESARTVRVLGVAIKPAQLAAKAQLAGKVALISASTSYVGNVATAAYYAGVKKDYATAKQIMKDAPRDAIFAGASAALLLPLARFNGLTGMAVGAVGDAGSQIAYNKISGRAWDDQLISSVVMGAAMGKIMETHRNVQAARKLDAAKVIGAEVHVPGDKAGLKWKIDSINANRGFAIVSTGNPPFKQKVIASVLSDANPHLTAKPGKDDVLVGGAPPKRAKSNAPMSVGPVLDVHHAQHFFQPGSDLRLKQFVVGKDVVYHDIGVAKDGTLTGSKSLGGKRETLKNLDGTKMTALDLVKNSPSSLLPAGMKVLDPSTGHTLTVQDVRGWSNPKVLVEARDASGKHVGYAELAPVELVARGVTGLDGKAVFDPTAVAAAKKESPSFTSFTAEAPIDSGTDVGPLLNGAGTDPRSLRTELEQRAQRMVAPALSDELGTRIDVSSSAAKNADGSVSLHVKLSSQGQDAAEFTLTVDSSKKKVRIDDVRVAEGLRGKKIGDKLFAAQGDFLSKNFSGWTVAAKVEKGSAAAKLFNRYFEGGKIPTLEARAEKIAPVHGWDRASVVSVDADAKTLKVERNGKVVDRSYADVLSEHPTLAVGLEINHDGQRLRITDVDNKGTFGTDPPGKRLSAQEVVDAAPDSIERMVSPPAVRVREPKNVNGTVMFVDAHGFKLVGTDKANNVAYLRDTDGKIQTRALDQVVYEHSGVALGSLSVAQHARYESRLMKLGDADLSDWAHLRAEAADVSHEHAALADRMFALGYSLPEIDSMMFSVRKVPQAELGAIFSGKGMTQHFQTSCAPAACLFGLTVADPRLAKLFRDHPDVAAWWQRNVLERNDGSAQPRLDADYGHRPNDATVSGTSAKPTRSGVDTHYYDAPELQPVFTAHGLSDPNFFKNREVKVVLKKFPEEIVRVYGDGKGNVMLESPIGSGKAKKVKLPLFEASNVNGRLELTFKQGKTNVPIKEIGLPKDVGVPQRDAGMTHILDNELIGLIEMTTGERYVVRDPTKFSKDQFYDAIDWSLGEGHPVALGVEWIDPTTKKPLDSSHQLWISESRTIKGKTEYLVYDPHFDEPKWLSKGQLYEYSPMKGMLGQPMHLLLPDYIPLKGGAILAGGKVIAGVPLPEGSLMRDRTADIAKDARAVIERERDNQRAGRPVDEDKRREALLAMAIANDRSGSGSRPRLVEFQKQFKIPGDNNVKAEIDVKTDSVLFEVTNGKGDDKAVQYEERLRAGQVGNKGQLPVVLLGSEHLDPQIGRAMDSMGVLVVTNIPDAVTLNRLYKSDPDVLSRLWSLDQFSRGKALNELLAARTTAARSEIATRYGLASGEMEVVNRRAEDVLAESAWSKDMTKEQDDGVRKYLAGRPADRSSRVAIIRREDGTVGVVLRTRVPKSNVWREQRVSFDKKGQTIE